jgi:predicted DNA-binding protein (UPF0251 family)
LGSHDGEELDGWSVSTLRELFRNLQAFRSFVESGGAEDLIWHGHEFNYWDLERIYTYSQIALPRRQYQAIFLCLYENVLEKDAAEMMGVSPTNPVAMYATKGLEKLLDHLRTGRIPNVRIDSYKAG